MPQVLEKAERDARREALRARLADIRLREAELEAEIGITPLAFAHEERRKARKALAAGEAAFGPGGDYPERRKAFRAKVATEIADALEQEIAAAHQAIEKNEQLDAKAKLAAHKEVRSMPSEAELERLAAGHPSVIRYMKAANRMKRKYLEQKDRATEWQEIINRGQAIARYVAGVPAAANEELDG